MGYEQFKIKNFDRWGLYLHEKQFPYIGRCYAWAIRPEADKVSDMNLDEREELFSTIIPLWEKVISEIYGEIRPNIAIFGNETPHLHAHLIPRFYSPRKFYGIEFIDPNPTGNYAPYPKKNIPLEVLLKIRDDIKAKI
ncbi:hypothetical protein JW756_03155 [Candidatus Woesearchaeota archaeon]|nr:hypothetical protein [Candidatus Woesearchaeota archaeon]